MKIPFLVGWTSINPSYFDVNYRGYYWFWLIPTWQVDASWCKLHMQALRHWRATFQPIWSSDSSAPLLTIPCEKKTEAQTRHFAMNSNTRIYTNMEWIDVSARSLPLHNFTYHQTRRKKQNANTHPTMQCYRWWKKTRPLSLHDPCADIWAARQAVDFQSATFYHLCFANVPVGTSTSRIEIYWAVVVLCKFCRGTMQFGRSSAGRWNPPADPLRSMPSARCQADQDLHAALDAPGGASALDFTQHGCQVLRLINCAWRQHATGRFPQRCTVWRGVSPVAPLWRRLWGRYPSWPGRCVNVIVTMSEHVRICPNMSEYVRTCPNYTNIYPIKWNI